MPVFPIKLFRFLKVNYLLPNNLFLCALIMISPPPLLQAPSRDISRRLTADCTLLRSHLFIRHSLNIQ
jgi:hypothetical protein